MNTPNTPNELANLNSHKVTINLAEFPQIEAWLKYRATAHKMSVEDYILHILARMKNFNDAGAKGNKDLHYYSGGEFQYYEDGFL